MLGQNYKAQLFKRQMKVQSDSFFKYLCLGERYKNMQQLEPGFTAKAPLLPTSYEVLCLVN